MARNSGGEPREGAVGPSGPLAFFRAMAELWKRVPLHVLAVAVAWTESRDPCLYRLLLCDSQPCVTYLEAAAVSLKPCAQCWVPPLPHGTRGLQKVTLPRLGTCLPPQGKRGGLETVRGDRH